MLNEEDLQTIMFSLRDMALEDIKRASEGGAKMGAFILASCFIDYLAGFFKGGKGKTTKGDYENLIRKYLRSEYDPKKLCKDMRNGLVHNYSEGGSYWFIDGKPEGHLKTALDGKTFINLEDFISDLEAALNDLYKDWHNDPAMAQRALNRYQKTGLLRPIQLPMVYWTPSPPRTLREPKAGEG